MLAARQLRIRPGMDVFDAYQRYFIGSVVRVWHGGEVQQPGAARSAEKEQQVDNAPMVHEEGHVASHASAQGSKMLGEELGPVPTMGVGNTGPTRQSAERDYATDERGDDNGSTVVCFAVRPGRFSLGPLTEPLYIPTSAVRSISMERVVLAVEGDHIPWEWRQRPQASPHGTV